MNASNAPDIATTTPGPGPGLSASGSPTTSGAVAHRFVEVDGIRLFYREAGPANAPAVLLPHGYPCSSFQFRRLLPALADRWRVVAPDYPGFGYSDTPAPAAFGYGFDDYAALLGRFADTIGLERFALYLQDYGTWIGLRLAMRDPRRITALMIQNGDIYKETMGPKYEVIQRYWADPSSANRAPLEAAVSEHGFRDEFVGEVKDEHAALIPPDLWKLHWPLMDTPERRELAVRLMGALKANMDDWFPRYQAFLREQRPPTLIVWGPHDGYMPEAAGRAYLRDLPKAEFHLTDGGHWLLETHFDQVCGLIRDFLGRLPVPASPGRGTD
jgi:pimeloyl-ACP methyl ester carboxylesterase